MGTFVDNNVKIVDLKNKVKKFCEGREWDKYHNAKDLSIGIITEAAELLEHFRFKSEREIEEFFEDSKKKKEISEELVDVLFFVLRFAQRYEIDLSDELEAKLKKSKLKYPVNKSKGSNKKYTELK